MSDQRPRKSPSSSGFLFKPMENNDAVLGRPRKLASSLECVFTVDSANRRCRPFLGLPSSDLGPAPLTPRLSPSLRPLCVPISDGSEGHLSSGQWRRECGGGRILEQASGGWAAGHLGSRVLPLFLSQLLHASARQGQKAYSKLGAWSQSRATYNSPAVLIFGARGNVRLSSLAGMFLSAPAN